MVYCYYYIFKTMWYKYFGWFILALNDQRFTNESKFKIVVCRCIEKNLTCRNQIEYRKITLSFKS